MSKKFFFISTAIDYPSGKPHLGHAYEKIAADVIARFKRLQGFEVHFSTGLDEHGLKIQRRAKKVGKGPQEFVDEMAEYFKKLSQELDISYDDFIRTTEKRHIKVAQKIFKKIYDKGDIYKGEYKGLYCVDCETFYLKKDLKNGKCPVHNTEPELIKEETYFFKMSRYQDKLIVYIKKNKDFIQPEAKRTEILNRLKEPLKDLSISRVSLKWGIPLPIDKKHIIFVWIEALCNYLTTIDYPETKFKKFWPANLHLIGKDIIWHHSVIWGSWLMAAGIGLPKKIFAHGFINIKGEKLSKAKGLVIDPIEITDKYGVDALRYFLLREIPFGQDGDFSIERLEERYNADLANGLGNLVSRVSALSARAEVFLDNIENFQAEEELAEQIKLTKDNYHKALENIKFNEALESIWQLIGICDKYIEKNKPWELSKDDKEKFKQIILNLLIPIKEISYLLKPFMPNTSEKILTQFNPNQKHEALFPRL